MSNPDSNHAPNSQPKVSVCIASYNHARFIGETLDSILAQTYRDFEIVIVDDGSTDDSLRILNSYAEKHPQVRVFTHPNHANKGVSRTANLAIEKSLGSYIVFIGSDDVWYPNFLEIQITELEKDKSIGMIYALAHYIDGQSNLLSGTFGKDVTDKGSALRELITGNKIPALTVVVRRECFDKIGRYNESLAYSDWELWIKIASHYKVKFNPAILAKYRIHGNNMSVGINVDKDSKYSADVVFELKKSAFLIGGELPENLDLLTSYHGKWITDYCLNQFFDRVRSGRFKEGLTYLGKAFSFYPRIFLNFRRLAAITKHSVIGLYHKFLSVCL